VVSNMFQWPIYDELLTVNDPHAGGATTSMMAQSSAFSDDGMMLTVKLRPGMLWSDGKPITADDVAFTWQTRLALPQAQSQRDTFESVQAADALTVVFRLKRLDCLALIKANIRPLPRHVFEGLDITQNEYNTKPAVTSGPFTLQEWVKDDHATYVANERYYLGRPHLDKVVIRVVKDLTVAAALFRTQEVDYLGVLPSELESISELPFAFVVEQYTSAIFWTYTAMKLDHPILKDVRVRQALSYAIDKQAIIKAVFLGHALPLSSFASERHWSYAPDVTRYNYNPDKARALLREAGWTPGADGIAVKDGKPLRLRLHWMAGQNMQEQIGVITQEYFRQIGVAVDLISEEVGAMLNRMYQTKDYDLVQMGHTAPDPDGSTSIFAKGGWIGYDNPEVNRLRTEGATVPGCRIEDRQKVYAQIQKLITADAPVIFMVTYPGMEAVNTRLDLGYDPATGSAKLVHEWFVRK